MLWRFPSAKLVAMLGIVLFSSSASAEIVTRQYGDLTIQTDTVANTVTGWKANDGTKMVIDHGAGKVLVYENDVLSAQLDLQLVTLEAAAGNVHGADTYKHFLRKGAGLNPQPRSWPTSIYNPYPCAMQPCAPGEGPGLNPWYSPPVFPGEEFQVSGGPDGTGVGPSAEMRQYDRWMFDQWQAGRCSDAHGLANNLLFASALVGTFIGCIGVETGGGAALCAAGYVAVVTMAEIQAQADEDCHEEYGGYMRWGGNN